MLFFAAYAKKKVREEDREAPVSAGGAHVREGQDRLSVGQCTEGESSLALEWHIALCKNHQLIASDLTQRRGVGSCEHVNSWLREQQRRQPFR